MKFIIFNILFLFLSLSYSYSEEPEAYLKNFFPVADRKPLPDTVFYNSQGEKLILDQFADKVIILNFWATWCTNCAKEIKLLDDLQHQLRKLPVKIVPLSIDFKDLETINKFYESHNIKYLEIFRDEKSALYNEFSTHGMPISVIIDEKGRVIGYFKGNVNWDSEEVRNWIISLTKNIKFEYLKNKESQEKLENTK
jgi:peroxiredoxin